MKSLLSGIALILLCWLTGCSSIGTPNPEVLKEMQGASKFGPPQDVRLCLFVDKGVTETEGRQLIEDSWNQRAGKDVNLFMKVVSVTSYEKEYYDPTKSVAQLWRFPITQECDRVFALVSRSPADIAVGLVALMIPLPEVLGGVILAHGFASAKVGSLQQALFMPVKPTIEHELFHLVGCGHDTMEACYERIALQKKARIKPDDFFPALVYTEKEDIEKHEGAPFLVTSREEINAIEAKWKIEIEAQQIQTIAEQ